MPRSARRFGKSGDPFDLARRTWDVIHIPVPTRLPALGRLSTKSGFKVCGAILLASSAVALFGQLQRPPAASAPTVVPSAPVETPGDRTRRLALAPVAGAAEIDAQIRGAAHAAQKLPRKSELWVALGQLWIRKARETSDPGYFINARACADVALELEPDNRLALDLHALVLLNDHEFADARAVAQRILSRDPDAATAWGTLSDAELELGDVNAAADAAQKMLALKPNLPSYSRAAHLSWLHGHERAALELARLAIGAAGGPADREPRAWMLVQTAMLFWHRGDYDGADAGFGSALDVMRDYPPALVGRGRVSAARGDLRRAAALFEQAFRKSPLVETAWLWGQALELAGDAAAAERAYAAAVRQGEVHDRRALSLMYSTRNVQADDALRLARAERAVRGDPYTEDALAWALYRHGKFDEARAASDRACALGTRDARLLFHQGAIRIAQGRAGEGRARVRAALQQNPKFDLIEAAEAERLLAEVRP
ncbi:MAG TPA: tetratricopeptide repeat protein [Polyangiaceae bacterium]